MPGVLDPLPSQVGGGATSTEEIYLELRKLVGDGGPGPSFFADPTSMESVEDLWRICKARIVNRALRSVERAALQALPLWASDHLEAYEDALGVAQAPTEAERQEAVAAAWTLALTAVIPRMREDLQAIEPGIDIVQMPYANHAISHFGKQFRGRDGAIAPAYGSGASAFREASTFPNYADAFVLRLRFTPSVTTPTLLRTKRAEIERYLCRALPSPVDFKITTSGPFLLDGGPDGTSVLDLTELG